MSPDEIIAALDLEPHPEGGHFRRTWTGPPGPDGRAIGSAIHYLVAAGERSHWHRIDAHECWVHNSGAPLALSVAAPGEAILRHVLGVDLGAGQEPQVVVPADAWQSAEPMGEWTLVSCVVTPGFEFDHFELAPPDWSPRT